ncbi:hypothetical protein EHR_02545 [Enterococcus hirae ATCC 9790]|uniref:Lysozyme n=1 Tax=Enterococcus hirae (strain ATCC 9790 / DSM 20160 / JCM 8729 / LMG 6399 / NBRC 3181 / NCIMB 6459 / NCDO 1258 / NCTC 12367 / WDCM 00089 / R) TaxID=768486 RepID=I6T8F8_ENTHA|nr:hypothetical protein EHR_02545 [Enterococcus hirae ATCC 9790]
MFKATEGCNFVDRYCDPFVQQAIKSGKPFGVYHFIDGSDWQTQTDFFIQKCSRLHWQRNSSFRL